MYFNSLFCLDIWDEEARYAIFDDFEDWSKFYNYKQFLGAQKEFVVSDKYKKKRVIKWGKPCIILSNENPGFRDIDWVNGNCITTCLLNKMF